MEGKGDGAVHSMSRNGWLLLCRDNYELSGGDPVKRGASGVQSRGFSGLGQNAIRRGKTTLGLKRALMLQDWLRPGGSLFGVAPKIRESFPKPRCGFDPSAQFQRLAIEGLRSRIGLRQDRKRWRLGSITAVRSFDY
jgi:hypothetical protein